MLIRLFSTFSLSQKLTSLMAAMLIVFGVGATSVQAQSDGVIINQIDVVGAQRIDPETILAYTPVNVGDAVSTSDLNNVLTSLFQTNLFNDVSLEVVEDKLVITVDENPIINRISIEGNDVLTDEFIRIFGY